MRSEGSSPYGRRAPEPDIGSWSDQASACGKVRASPARGAIDSAQRIFEALATASDLTLASEILLSEGQKIAPCHTASVHCIDPSVDEAITVLFAPVPPAPGGCSQTFALSGSWLEQLISAGLPRTGTLQGNKAFFQEMPECPGGGMEAGIWVPLSVQGSLLGVLSLFSRDSCAFDQNAQQKAEALADMLAPAVASAARWLQAEQQQRFAGALARVSKCINGGPGAGPVTHTIARECRDLLQASQVVIRDVENDGPGRPLALVPEELPVNGRGQYTSETCPDTGVCHRVAFTGATEVINRTDVSTATRQGDAQPVEISSRMVVPLMVDGRALGTLEVSHVNTGRSFTGRQVEMAESLASLAAVALQNTRIHEETQKTLRLSEAQQRAIQEAVPDAMFRIGRDGTYLDYIAPADFDLYVPPEKFLGKSVSEVLPPDIARESMQGISKALSSRQVQTQEYQLSMDGVVRDYEARIVAHGDDEVLAIVRDVTERKLLEAQFLQSQKMESLGRLAGGIAHDFNNLLGGILGYASLLKGKVPPTSEAHEFASIIESATQRGARLTQQLLTAARKSSFEAHPVDVSEVMREIVQMLSRTLPREIQVVDHVRSNLPLVQGDQTQVHQVLMNLCINAADAMPEGGTLTLSCQEVFLDHAFCQKHLSARPGRHIRLEVADTGTGISQEDQPKIFDPFFTTKDPDKGTGLGLAVVYAIVRNHQGLIEVASAPGQGSRFTVYLPVHEPTPG